MNLRDMSTAARIAWAARQLRSLPQLVPQAQSSTLGVRILAAVEAVIGTTISCGTCRNYLTTLAETGIIDSDVIVQRLAAEIEVTPLRALCDQYSTRQTRQEWLRPIVDAAMLAWLDSDTTETLPTT
jgi:hypothetical protein